MITLEMQHKKRDVRSGQRYMITGDHGTRRRAGQIYTVLEQQGDRYVLGRLEGQVRRLEVSGISRRRSNNEIVKSDDMILLTGTNEFVANIYRKTA